MAIEQIGFKIPVIIYPSEDSEGGAYTAHCLNMDIVADDDRVEGAVSNLLESIEVALEAAQKFNANPFRDAPKEYWDKLARAKPLPAELMERIILSANQRPRGAHHESIIDVERNCDLRQVDDLQPA